MLTNILLLKALETRIITSWVWLLSVTVSYWRAMSHSWVKVPSELPFWMQVKLCLMHCMALGCRKCCKVWKQILAFLLRPLLPILVVVLQIFEGVVNLLDRLKAWHSTPGSPGNTELKEMAQIGLRIITGYIQQQRSPVSYTHNMSSPVHQP